MKGLLLVLIVLATSEVFSQGKLVGGRCQGCEAVFEYGDRALSPVDTLPEFNTKKQKIRISGTVYQADGITPAPDVILYVYQTNEEGVYPKKGNETGWARRHGYLRGWVKTDKHGSYTIYTQKPELYRSEPAHIHVMVLEPNGKYYYIQNFLFEGDKNITEKIRNNPTPRGGNNGIMELFEKGELLVGKRDIILGKHVPDYN